MESSRPCSRSLSGSWDRRKDGSAYCEKLLPMLRDEEGRAWWMLTTFTDQVLGEIPHMRYIDSFDVLEESKAEPSFLLSQLPDKLREQGLELSR